MFINSILINNFKVYYKTNLIEFKEEIGKNLYIISGHNGYGKTTFLSALVWCLYGHNMRDVDDKFKEEIVTIGGYKKFLKSALNRIAKSEQENQFSVEVEITGITFPSLPDSNIKIIRSYDIVKDHETFSVLINGKENELTKQVGLDIFINDFLLPKEIAKFFFFDSEKIVEFAELKSIDDRRKLSKAYSEVLGIKKYEDLKENLENLKLRIKKDVASDDDRKFLEKLEQEKQEFEDNIQLLENKITVSEDEKQIKKKSIANNVESLIREGNALSVEQYKNAKNKQKTLQKKLITIQNELKNFLDLAPFAIAKAQLENAKKQIDKERLSSPVSLSQEIVNKKLATLKDELEKIDFITSLDSKKKSVLKSQIRKIVKRQFIDESDYNSNKGREVLLDFSTHEINSFYALNDNINSSFSKRFEALSESYKENKLKLGKITRFINDFERKENDPIVQGYRENIEKAEKKISELDDQIIQLKTEIELYKRDIAIKLKMISQISKKVDIGAENRSKVETINRLINNLEVFIKKHKEQKRNAIEEGLLRNLILLMHKKKLISRVQVNIYSDLIDIDLIDYSGSVIPKNSLSKGEQQLYATALLKTLVDESNLQFPVFIDSPLQKFDHKHTANIIKEFYPNISKQVILFPLIEKEINQTEFILLEDKIKSTYVINNKYPDASVICSIEKEDLFSNYFENGKHNVQIN